MCKELLASLLRREVAQPLDDPVLVVTLTKFGKRLPAKTVFLVDERASEAQRSALVEFAQSQVARLLNDVVAVEPEPISLSITGHGRTTLQAGSLAELSTRAIGLDDHLCHNEEVYYQPLAGLLTHAMPVVVVSSQYRGNHLGVTRNDAGRRSSFIDSFSD